MVCLFRGSNQIMASSRDWSTPWEVNVVVEGYLDKDLKVMPLNTAQMRTMAIYVCVSHWNANK